MSLAVVHQELRVITRILEAGLEGQLQRSDVLAVLESHVFAISKSLSDITSVTEQISKFSILVEYKLTEIIILSN